MSADLTTAIVAFTLDLYKQLLSESSGNTATEITNVLHTKDDMIHAHFADFFAKVATYAPDVTLDIANRMYTEQTFKVLESYLSALKKFYNSTVVPVDFKNNAEAARLAVNAWVEETTKSKIKDLPSQWRRGFRHCARVGQCHLLQGPVEGAVQS
ncbi:hypothetical protein MTO96_011214 [Rhipicephalus appendiculatus]